MEESMRLDKMLVSCGTGSRKDIAAELKGSDIKEKANEMSIARYQEELAEYQEKEMDCKAEVEELHLQDASLVSGHGQRPL